MSKKRKHFQLFTYSFHMKQELFFPPDEAKHFGITKAQDAFDKKNELLKSKIWNEAVFYRPGEQQRVIRKKPESEDPDGERFLLRMGNEKRINLPDEKLVDHIEKWYPYAYVYFDNRPTQQVLAIECNPAAFTKPGVLAKVIELNINIALAPFNLECRIKPQLNENDFWKFVRVNRKKITRLQFLVLAPNLPRISASVPEAFKQLQRDTNSQSAKLELQSASDGYLHITKDSNSVKGLAKATADGGGEISVQIGSVRKLVRMKQGTREVAISDFHAQGDSKAVLQALESVIEEEP